MQQCDIMPLAGLRLMAAIFDNITLETDGKVFSRNLEKLPARYRNPNKTNSVRVHCPEWTSDGQAMDKRWTGWDSSVCSW